MSVSDDLNSVRRPTDLNPQLISPPREERIKLASSQCFDILVIGGGIHGVCMAKLAAKAGLKVLLLEKKDFAGATSSRSSKMAHGGLRYLEMLDFKQVFEGIKSREELFERIPNLVIPERFLIPIKRRDYWSRLKLGIGLQMYDAMLRNSVRRHSWISRRNLSARAFHARREDLEGCYQYTDGLMNDARIVFDLLVSAQSWGCCAINYASVDKISQQEGSSSVISWTDSLSSNTYTSQAGLVINCAGPWAASLLATDVKIRKPAVKFSRGSHLIFSVPWRDPSLFLPLADKGRYYFVWPHPSGTMVGTTEREVADLEFDPMPTQDEVNEILERLRRDLPDSGLNRSTLHYAFAGIRTLPLRRNKVGVSQLSRKHIWLMKGGILTLLGGKWTTFAWTASEGMRQALKYLGIQTKLVPDALDDLPSAITSSEFIEVCCQIKSVTGASGTAVERAVRRLGRLTLRYLSRQEAWSEISPGVLYLEVLHGIELEQGVCIEDLLRRRLDLEYTPSHGKEALIHIKRALAGKCTEDNLAIQESEWRERLCIIEGICRGTHSD